MLIEDNQEKKFKERRGMRENLALETEDTKGTLERKIGEIIAESDHLLSRLINPHLDPLIPHPLLLPLPLEPQATRAQISKQKSERNE